MFKGLTVKNGPVHKGKSFDFQNGTTAIIGENGCGKSLLVEYMGFALFGSVALRGKVTDYKDLEVSCVVEIKGKLYRIERDTKNCKIFASDDSLLCTGTKACNLKIVALLGYDYNVYKMGNYAAQLDILGLGNMKPSERKTALDRTLGIGVLDKVIKRLNDTALQNQHQFEAVSGLLREPGEEPKRPLEYKESNDIAKEYRELDLEIISYKNFQQTKMPVEPEDPRFKYPLSIRLDTSLEEIRKVLDKRKELTTKLEQYESCQKPTYTIDQLNEIQDQIFYYSKWLEYQLALGDCSADKFNGMVDSDKLDIEQLSTQLWENYDRDMELYKRGCVTCPKCGEIFSLDRKEPQVPFVARPKLTKEELLKQVTLRQEYQSIQHIRDRYKEVIERGEIKEPILNNQQIAVELHKIKLWDEKTINETLYKSELNELPEFTDKDLNLRIAYEKEVAIYQSIYSKYKEDMALWSNMKEKFKDFDLNQKEGDLYRLSVLYQACKDYETNMVIWNRLNEEYQNAKDKADTYEKEANRYKQGVENLKEMKVKIKGYVLPSLQKVSSLLLSEMSDGLYNSISISPEFDILVEGREISLFSGSEQAMINLALRLGLGQVLTHKVFSVFIGDEIDASMREERAKLTADCLRKISKYIKQVILVSHRNIEADHYIDLSSN